MVCNAAVFGEQRADKILIFKKNRQHGRLIQVGPAKRRWQSGRHPFLKAPQWPKEQKPTPENGNGKQAEKSYCHSKYLRQFERLVVPSIGIGVGLTASPSHTTVHTGPYTAVRWVKRPCSPRGKLGRARRGRRSGER